MITVFLIKYLYIYQSCLQNYLQISLCKCFSKLFQKLVIFYSKTIIIDHSFKYQGNTRMMQRQRGIAQDAAVLVKTLLQKHEPQDFPPNGEKDTQYSW
jgi:hypothetical protein